ncbi:MAG: hypothetical protein HY706_00760 [Candidatus Hydrogenedentes bacterium]|nr:hypothetical protein [Candidatus Hydrogenedentota bacterium]
MYLRALCILSLTLAISAYAEPPAPEQLDTALSLLLQVDPALLVAQTEAHRKQAEAWESEAAELRRQADEIDARQKELVTKLEATISIAKALMAALEPNSAAPADAQMMAPTPTPEMTPAAAPAPPDAMPEAAPAVNFDDNVKAIFKARCVRCHNNDQRKSGLSLESHETALQGGSSGQVIVPGQPDGSRLLRLISRQEQPYMPPSGDPVNEEQLNTIREWIRLGAPANKDSKTAMAKAEATAAAVVVAVEDSGPPPMPEVPLDTPVQASLSANPVARAMTTSPRAPLLAVAGYRQVLLYQLEKFELLGALAFPEGEIHALTFNARGNLLLAGGGRVGESGVVVLWDVRTGKRLGAYGEEYDTVLAADVSPDGRLVAIGGPSKKVKVYALADASLLYKLESHTDWVLATRFTPDGEVLATGDRAGGLFLWQAANGRPVEALRGHTGAVNDLACSADSSLLASAGADSTVQVWDTWKYSKVREFKAHDGAVLSVDFSRDGQIVTGGEDALIKRWDSNGSLQTTYEKLPDWGYQARFGAQGALVLAGTWTGDIAVWNASSGERVASLSTFPKS